MDSVDWNGGMEWWNGMVEWTGLEWNGWMYIRGIIVGVSDL